MIYKLTIRLIQGINEIRKAKPGEKKTFDHNILD